MVTLIPVKHVVSDKNKLTKTRRVQEAKRLRAMKIRVEDCDEMTDLIFRTEKLENPDCEDIEKEAGKRMIHRMLQGNKKEQPKQRVEIIVIGGL